MDMPEGPGRSESPGPDACGALAGTPAAVRVRFLAPAGAKSSLKELFLMKRKTIFPFLFSLIMLAAVLFLVWYVPAVSGRAFQLEDLQKSLETSQGRERKQQFEYDKVVSEIPEIQAELDLIQPQTDAAEKEFSELKAERKKLKKEKKELEKQLGQTSGQEDSGDD